MRNLLSRYKPRYIRSLVYMLQASEYYFFEFLRWYHRTLDFDRVEKRKRLVMTPKSILLLVFGILIVLVFFAGAVTSCWLLTGIARFIVPILLIVAYPFSLPYLLGAPLLMINLIERPAIHMIIRKARRKLSSHKGLKIAIAGSYGKTSMREMLKTVLSEGKLVAAPSHSYNTPLGISKFIETLSGNEEILLFELGEYYPGDIRKLCDLIHPDMGVITGVNEAHLQKFKDLDKTTRTIFELADYLGSRPVYVNAESFLAKERATPDHKLYKQTGTDEWKAIQPHTGLNGTNFILSHNGNEIEIETQLLGLHNIGPLSAVADIASRLGLSPDQIKSGIAKTAPYAHRLEKITDSSGVITLDDSYNGNPTGVKAVIEFLATIKEHRRWYVTPGLVEMGDQVEELHMRIGQQLALAGIEKTVLIRNSVTPYIETGLKKSSYSGDIIWFDDALSAFAALPQMTVKGDIVLLQNDWPDQYA